MIWKKLFTHVTKRQEEILDFWSMRGFNKLDNSEGTLSGLFLKRGTEPNEIGIPLKSLEQFYQIPLDKVSEGIRRRISDLQKEYDRTNSKKTYAVIRELKELKTAIESL